MNSKNKYENLNTSQFKSNEFNNKSQDTEKKPLQEKISIRKRVYNKIINYFDYVFIKYLMVERSRNRRKYIWKTKAFREIVFLHIPRMLYVFGMVFACTKINNRAKRFKNYLSNDVEVKSEREDNVEKQEKVLEKLM